jgi:hypothetical protein
MACPTSKNGVFTHITELEPPRVKYGQKSIGMGAGEYIVVEITNCPIHGGAPLGSWFY